MKYRKFEVWEKGNTTIEAFLKAKSKWRLATPLKCAEYFGGEPYGNCVVSPNGMIYTLHKFYHHNDFVYDVTLKTKQQYIEGGEKWRRKKLKKEI